MLMEWPEIRLGTKKEALVNTHKQSLSLAVSAEEVTIKRGDEGEPGEGERERETGFKLIFLFFSEEVTVQG